MRAIFPNDASAQADLPGPNLGPDASGAVRHVLVVEDLDVIRDLATLMLQLRGYAVDCAEDGQTALDRLNARAYDLVLLDLMLPDIGGLEIVRRLRASETVQGRTQVLALSAWARPADKAAALAAGVDGFLAKPFTQSQLWEAVDGRLGQRAA